MRECGKVKGEWFKKNTINQHQRSMRFLGEWEETQQKKNESKDWVWLESVNEFKGVIWV